MKKADIIRAHKLAKQIKARDGKPVRNPYALAMAAIKKGQKLRYRRGEKGPP